jgi:hypothetical protein
LKFNDFSRSPATPQGSCERHRVPELTTSQSGPGKQIPDDRIEQVDAGWVEWPL